MKDASKSKKDLVRELAEMRNRTADPTDSENHINETDAPIFNIGRILEASLDEIYIFHSDNLRFLTVNKGA